MADVNFQIKYTTEIGGEEQQEQLKAHFADNGDKLLDVGELSQMNKAYKKVLSGAEIDSGLVKQVKVTVNTGEGENRYRGTKTLKGKDANTDKLNLSDIQLKKFESGENSADGTDGGGAKGKKAGKSGNGGSSAKKSGGDSLVDEVEEHLFNDNLEAQVARLRSNSQRQQRRIRTILNSMLANGNLSWREFISYMNLQSMSSKELATEAASWAIVSLEQIERRQAKLIGDMKGMDREDDNYASQLQGSSQELSQLGAQRSAVMNFIRDGKASSDEFANVVKSLLDNTLPQDIRRMLFQ